MTPRSHWYSPWPGGRESGRCCSRPPTRATPANGPGSRDHRLADELVIAPGVIDSTTNFVEHPELVAQRIERFANLVGRERVIAGTDCGFGTFAGAGAVDEEIVWAKLGALVEGARIASRRLWARRRRRPASPVRSTNSPSRPR